MHQTINAIETEDDRERVLQRIEELSGAIEQSPEEVELILLTLALGLWEMRGRTAAMPAAQVQFARPGEFLRNVAAARQLKLHQSRWRLRCVPSRSSPG